MKIEWRFILQALVATVIGCSASDANETTAGGESTGGSDCLEVNEGAGGEDCDSTSRSGRIERGDLGLRAGICDGGFCAGRRRFG